MLGPDRVPMLVAVSAMAMLGIWILSIRPAHRPHRVFALLLIARSLSIVDAYESVRGTAAVQLWIRLDAAVELSLPFLAIAFVLLTPWTRRPARNLWVWLLLGGTLVAVEAVNLLRPGFYANPTIDADGRFVVLGEGPLAWVVYAQWLLYAGIAAYLAYEASRSPIGPLKDGFFLQAVGWVCLPAYMSAFFWSRCACPTATLNFSAGPRPDPMAQLTLAGILMTGVFLVVNARLHGGEWRRTIGALALVAVVMVYGFLAPHWNIVIAGQFSLRDIVYHATLLALPIFVTWAILRNHLFDDVSRNRENRLATMTTILLGTAASTVVIGQTMSTGSGGPEVSPADLLLLSMGLLLGFIVLFVFRRSLQRRYHATSATDSWNRPNLVAYRTVLEIWRRNVERRTEFEDLEPLRRKLGVSLHEHQALWVMADAAHVGSAHPVLARFRVERPLGHGVWGQVFLATERATGRRVVLKRLRDDLSDHPLARGQFHAEAEVLQTLRHPNVVSLLEVVADANIVLVIEHLPGGSLADMVAASDVPRVQAITIVLDVLDGLHAVHQRGLVHLDIKPSNILLTESGRAKIGDFGTVRRLARPHDTLGVARPRGTLAYMAPEQAAGRAAGVQADLFAGAVVLYELLMGVPYRRLEGLTEEAALRSLQEPVASASFYGLPTPLAHLLARNLSANPNSRMRSAAEFREHLARCLVEAPGTGSPPVKGAVVASTTPLASLPQSPRVSRPSQQGL